MTKKIYVPTESFVSWQRLLAQPDRHWKEGYSAMTVARAWEAAEGTGFPPEISAILATSDDAQLSKLKLLLAIPEYKVDLPGGSRPSQTDVLAIGTGQEGLVAIAIEAKVNETFGPTLGERRAEPSLGAADRLQFLIDTLQPQAPVGDALRYQLLHRAVSELLTAKQFHAKVAVMLVQSFSAADQWFEDFTAFAAVFGAKPQVGELALATTWAGIPLYIGWCRGDRRFAAHAPA